LQKIDPDKGASKKSGKREKSDKIRNEKREERDKS